ncbi:uncharacterized protein LOC112693010 [Sipha flava]|uniref:Uncharacterized protein LOC112693010 n=1 Tax=Sipha flava TaxID=143950 RepID=A0A8B8GKT2_9HEMI|nr:uncharacterized protein LOC112693010 [Sipha flava]
MCACVLRTGKSYATRYSPDEQLDRAHTLTDEQCQKRATTVHNTSRLHSEHNNNRRFLAVEMDHADAGRGERRRRSRMLVTAQNRIRFALHAGNPVKIIKERRILMIA